MAINVAITDPMPTGQRSMKPKVYAKALEGPVLEKGAIESLLYDYRTARKLIKRLAAWDDDPSSGDLPDILDDARLFLGMKPLVP